MSGFARLKMKTKNVCHGLISERVNFHNNELDKVKVFFSCKKLAGWEGL